MRGHHQRLGCPRLEIPPPTAHPAGEKSHMWPLKGGILCTQKRRTSSGPHPTTVHAKAENQDRASSIWGTRTHSLQSAKGKSEAQRAKMLVQNCIRPTPKHPPKITQHPTTQRTRTRECKALYLQFLLIKALTCLDCELQHHFSTSFYMCLVTRIPHLTHMAHILRVFSPHSPALHSNCNSTSYTLYAAAPNHKKGSN